MAGVLMSSFNAQRLKIARSKFKTLRRVNVFDICFQGAKIVFR